MKYGLVLMAWLLAGNAGAQPLPMDEALEQQEASAQVIYRTRLPDGSFKLSDEPVNDSSEALRLPGIPEVGSVRTVPSRSSAGASEVEAPVPPPFNPADYQLAITAPATGQTLVHPDAVTVSVSLTPGLPEGYRLEVLHGGQLLEGSVIQMPSRGGHQVRARVLDPEGREVLASNTVEFTVLRPSRLIK